MTWTEETEEPPVRKKPTMAAVNAYDANRRAVEALRGMVDKWAPHSGLCCVLDENKKIVVTPSSCVCSPLEKQARAALAAVDEATLSKDAMVRTADIRAALEEIEKVQGMRIAAVKRAEAAEAEIERLKRPMDVPHTTSCGHTWTMRHTACPTCFAELRAREAKLREALREWVPLHSAACCMPDPGSGTFPEGPLKPDWCRCDARVKRTRAALAEEPRSDGEVG